ncbi:MAG: hypothetical protein AAGF48_10045 [Pseudomonadota bacterium]
MSGGEHPMTPWLVLVSGWIEVLFGASAMLAPSMVVAAIGGSDLDGPAMVLVQILGVATFAIGVGALLGRNWSAATDGQKTAYGLGSYAAISLAIYNVLAAPPLIFGAVQYGGAGLWGAALLHSVVAGLFIYALAVRR